MVNIVNESFGLLGDVDDEPDGRVGGGREVPVESVGREDVGVALSPGASVRVRVSRASGRGETVPLVSRVDTRREADWLRSGGILPYVLNELGAA